MSPRRVIGGMFGLADEASSTHGAPLLRTGEHTAWLAGARSGIRLFVRETGARRVWIPSYLCPVVLDALGGLDVDVRFYGVDERLTVDRGALDGVERDDVVLVIDYFGRHADDAAVSAARAGGARVLEDASQALLTSDVGARADAVVFSPRKWVGVPDGGLLVRAAAPARAIEMDRPPPAWLRAQSKAAAERRAFDDRGAIDDDRGWYRWFQEAEDAPRGVFPMTRTSRERLDASFDRAAITSTRVANWRVLAGRLAPVSLFDIDEMARALERGVVPLGFVCAFADEPERDRVRSALIADSVFPPVHWPLAGFVPDEYEASHRLSARILTLPCDQRYGAAEMHRIADDVERGLGRILTA